MTRLALLALRYGAEPDALDMAPGAVWPCALCGATAAGSLHIVQWSTPDTLPGRHRRRHAVGFFHVCVPCATAPLPFGVCKLTLYARGAE